MFSKLLVLVAVAHCAPVPTQENHEQRFMRVDENKNKELSFDEFLHMELAYVEAKKEEFDMLDKNKDGKIKLSEYEEHFHEASNKNEKSRTAYFAKVFEDFDEDFNMSLDQDELEAVLNERFLVRPRENFPKLFFKFDVDHSGGLDLTEYMKFDAEFPFDQTDPIGRGSPAHPTKDAGADDDAAAIAAVMAQASPIHNKPAAPAAPAAGLHPVSPGAHNTAVPIKKA